LLGIKTYLNRLRHIFLNNCRIASDAKIDSFVRLGNGCVVRGGSRVLGLVESGDNVTFAENCIVRGHVSIGDRSHIGVGNFIENYTGPDTRIKIGKYCSFGPGVVIYGNTHHSDFPSTAFIVEAISNFEWALKKGLTTIGNDVWLGARSFIAPGIKIGDGAIIGAGAVVINDVMPYEIVGGIPAKKLKMRFPEDIIQKLLKVCWWDWPSQKIKEYAVFFTNPIRDVSDIPDDN
jgi:virginiamycin A acetyltransferase